MWWEQRAGRLDLMLRTMTQRKLCVEVQQSPAAMEAVGMEGLDDDDTADTHTAP